MFPLAEHSLSACDNLPQEKRHTGLYVECKEVLPNFKATCFARNLDVCRERVFASCSRTNDLSRVSSVILFKLIICTCGFSDF